jgi:hypothetical protein
MLTTAAFWIMTMLGWTLPQPPLRRPVRSRTSHTHPIGLRINGGVVLGPLSAVLIFAVLGLPPPLGRNASGGSVALNAFLGLRLRFI